MFFRYQSWLQDAAPNGSLLHVLSPICMSLEDILLCGVQISTRFLWLHACQELASQLVTLGSLYSKWKSRWCHQEPVTKHRCLLQDEVNLVPTSMHSVASVTMNCEGTPA